MKTNKYKNVPIVKLRLLYSQHNSPERDEIMDEMARQELARETRSKRSYFIQWTILILTIIVVAFTIYSFAKETTSDIVSKKRKSIRHTNTSSIQNNKQNNTQGDIQNNKNNIKQDIHISNPL